MNLVGLSGVSAWNVYNKVAFNLVFLRANTLKYIELAELIDECEAVDDLVELKKRLPDLLQKAEFARTTHEQAIRKFKQSDTAERIEQLVEALSFANLTDEEIYRLLAVQKDANGISYSRANIANLDASELMPLMLEVLVECSYCDFDLSLVNTSQFSALKGRINVDEDVAQILTTNTSLGVRELISLAISKASQAFANNKGE